jgi:predicted transcriptional regulator
MKFEVLRQAGVTQGEFAHYLKVSRVTVNNWISGKGKVHEARVPRVQRLLDAIASAVAEGKLPVQNVPKEERLAAIGMVLVVHLRANKD